MHQTVIVVAGGVGNRMQSELPKQFIEVAGLPVLMHTLKRFYSYNSQIEIRLVLPGNQIQLWNKLQQNHNFTIDHKVYEGGDTRFASVKNGLHDLLPGSLVAIHDGVRPFVSPETIKRGFDLAITKGAVVPVIDLHDTLREIKGSQSITVWRQNYRLVQTPQVFQTDILLKAYEQNYRESFTDDASVVESAGFLVSLFEGNRENIKITTPQDLLMANVFAGLFT